ncbi:type II secretion system minor pseudopilin GspH [Microbulbifer rhizosphaerae]|uniref:type II secretion system minor pseudopilin GspH n=1 Tax=Microbulbifer rhizosphaerae TaxID=1562603 RepID=UPI00161E6C8A|nr:type II secretion system minor pseudopilin GspH [Microbulbifer rhizosphaerae]
MACRLEIGGLESLPGQIGTRDSGLGTRVCLPDGRCQSEGTAGTLSPSLSRAGSRVPGSGSRQSGFTLIEILVVIVIIATLAGMAVLSLGGAGNRNWTGEVQRLASLLQLVADRALIDKAHYGVMMESDGYSVVRFDAAAMKWQALDTESAGRSAARFASHQLPENIRLEVLEEAQMPGAESKEFAAERKEEEEQLPQFVALSSGEILPVELAMFLLSDGDISRGASISYTSLAGLKVEWQVDD